MSEEGQHNAREKYERVEEVDKRNDEIDADEERRKPGSFQNQTAVLLQALDHAARPALALAVKTAKGLRRAGEADGRGLEADAPAAVDQRPGRHDVFADHGRPAFVGFDYLRAKG